LPLLRLCGLFVVTVLRAQVPVKVVQERLGHSTPAITMGIYQHTTPGMDDDHLDDLVPRGLRNGGRDDVRLLIALGSVVQQTSVLDLFLRGLYVDLVGFKYAAITAGGQHTGWLLDQTKAIVQRREDVGEDDRRQLSEILSRGKQANRTRNRLVHDLWAVGDGGPALVRSKLQSHGLYVTPITLDEVVALHDELQAIGIEISMWRERVLGRDEVALEFQLRYEESQATAEGRGHSRGHNSPQVLTCAELGGVHAPGPLTRETSTAAPNR